MTDTTPEGAADAEPVAKPTGQPLVAAQSRIRAVATPVRLLSVALAAMLFAVGALGWQVRADNRIDDARREALSMASIYAVNLTSYNHATLDGDVARVLEHSTGAFREEYTAASDSLRELIQKFRASATGVVLSTGVLRADSNSAEILLFVDQTVRNTNTPEPRIDRTRMLMGLEKQGGRWLISSLGLV